MASTRTTYSTSHPTTGEPVTFTKGGRPIRWITWGDLGDGFVHFGFSSQEEYKKAVRAPRSTNPYASRYEATAATVVDAEQPAEQQPPTPAAEEGRDNGFAVRRLRTSELATPVGELRGLPRVFSPASETPLSVMAARAQQDKEREAALYAKYRDEAPLPEVRGLPSVVAAAPARTVTVTTGFTRKSIPTRLRESGAPGQMVTSEAAGGALRWRLPGGEELTPGEAAQRFLTN